MAIFAFKKKMLSTAVAAAMLSGMVVSNNASAIHLAEDGIGQVLLAPYYTVESGYRTKFAIVNTRDDVAVKAKIVIRSKAQTTEVLDFICYLSPADVCRFEIINKNGQAYLYSDDDSVKSSGNPLQFASQKPVEQMLFDDTMKLIDSADINEVGHVEIIGAYAATGAVITPSGPVVIKRTMTKFDLVKVFDTPRDVLNSLNGPEVRASGRLVNNVCTSLDSAPTDYDAGAPCPAPAGVIRSADPNVVRLSGSVEVVKEDNSDRMGYNIPALAGELWDNAPDGVRDPGQANDFFDGRVIHNPRFDVTVAQYTAIGDGFPIVGSNIVEIEHALATTNVAGTYENKDPDRTSLIVTFPTRYQHRGYYTCTATAPSAVDPVRIGALYTAPFRTNGTVKYSLTAYDNQENKEVSEDIFSGGQVTPNFLYAEVNYIIPNWPYSSGWYDLAFVETVPGCSYSGVPALSMKHKWMTGTHTNSALTPAAHWPELTNRQFDDVPVWNDMGL